MGIWSCRVEGWGAGRGSGQLQAGAQDGANTSLEQPWTDWLSSRGSGRCCSLRAPDSSPPCTPRLSGLSPFLGDDDTETLNNVLAANWYFDEETFESVSDEAKDFVSNLIIKDKRCEAGSGHGVLGWASPSTTAPGTTCCLFTRTCSIP